MFTRSQGINAGIQKTRDQLLAAVPVLRADGALMRNAVQQGPSAGKGATIDHTPEIAAMQEHLKTLRSAILAEKDGGAPAQAARDITARTLLESDQALAKLAESFRAPDQKSSLALVTESNNLVKKAQGSSVLAAKALGIPWPL